ncbi:zinc ion binding, partial [Striga asiatica]
GVGRQVTCSGCRLRVSGYELPTGGGRRKEDGRRRASDGLRRAVSVVMSSGVFVHGERESVGRDCSYLIPICFVSISIQFSCPTIIGVWWISYKGTGGEMDAVVHPHCEWSGGAEAVLALEPNSSISIAYDSLFGPHDDLMLLELDEKLLPEVMHERVALRGQPDDDVVLCTSSKTYGVKFVGTSNSMFLIPSSDKKDVDKCNTVAHVIKLTPGCMELTEVAPKLDELKLILSENPYSYGEESKTENGLYKWADLTDRIRASDEEIKSGLQSLSAVEINGYWRILNENYMNGILNMLLHNIILNDWSIDELDEGEVVGVLEKDGFPRNVAKHCLRVFCNMAGVAREILREGKMRMEVFMERWSRKLPEGMDASFEVLEGEVLTEKLGVETWVYWFSKRCLPSEPAERFAVLFRERQKWEWKDLEPYGSKSAWTFFGRFAPEIYSKKSGKHGGRTHFQCKIVLVSGGR